MKIIAKKLFCLTVALLIVMALPLTAGAQTTYDPFFHDDASVLGGFNFEGGQWMEIETTLMQLSGRLHLNVGIATIETLDFEDIEDYTQNYYDTHYHRTGGVLLLVAMEEREWYIYTTGDAYDYLTDAALDDIEDAMVPLLSKGNYFEAFKIYAELCDKYLTMGQEGNVYRGSFPIAQNIFIALLIGVGVGLITVSVMKSKLKSVRPRREAHEYTRPGSMKITQSRDLYLYRTVHRRPKPKDSSSSGGRSGGGSRSGGRGGRF